MSAPAVVLPETGRGDSPRDLGKLLVQLAQRLRLEAETPPVIPPPGYRPDAKGRLVPDSLIRSADELEDQTTRRIAAYAIDLADQIARFKRHTYADVATLLEIMASEYGAGRKPGRKGNFSIASFDGLLRVSIQVQDRITFGPELQAARKIIDDCIQEWAEGAPPQVQALVQHAFQPDTEGNLSAEAVLRLRRLDIDDDRWRQAQRAIHDSIRPIGTRTYLRIHFRGATDAPWRPVPIDISSSWTETQALAEAAAAEATT